MMKIITFGLVLMFCALVIAGQGEQLSGKKDNNGSIKEANDDGRMDQEDMDESGSSADVETNEGSGEFGSGEISVDNDGNQPQMAGPKPMKFRYFGLRGPVTITPMEPMINRQKPFRRRCFFCFPRGRLGRVEVVAPGGPYLMNGFGPMNGFDMGPYPGMGLPEPGAGFPDMGGFGGPCCGGPCCGGPCCGGPCGGEDANQGPMIFQGMNEEEEEPSKPPHRVHDKPMQQPPNKAMGQAPNKVPALPPNKVMDQSPNQTPNKLGPNEHMKNLQTAEKLSDKPIKAKPEDEE